MQWIKIKIHWNLLMGGYLFKCRSQNLEYSMTSKLNKFQWVNPMKYPPLVIYCFVAWTIQDCFLSLEHKGHYHYNDVIMDTIASQITSLTIVFSTVYLDADKKKTSKLRVTGLCAGNSPGTGEFPAQMASNAENVYIWWRHHAWQLVVSRVVGPLQSIAFSTPSDYQTVNLCVSKIF